MKVVDIAFGGDSQSPQAPKRAIRKEGLEAPSSPFDEGLLEPIVLRDNSGSVVDPLGKS